MTQCLSDEEIRGLADGSLVGERRTWAEQHVAACPACAERLDRVRSTSGGSVHKAPTQVEVTSAVEIDVPSRGSSAHWTDGLSIPPAADYPVKPPSVSVDEFLTGLSQSGLLPPAELANVRQKTTSDSSTSTVAGLIEWLVQEHKLTRYQADLLARGQTGGLVLGNYIILEKLGQGGMGTVFKARHRRMNRVVALKVLPHSLSGLPEAIARFQREVEAAARLHHPNIAAAYDADEASGVHFLVMEYVDGPNLASFVKNRGPLPVAAAVRLLEQAALGLAAAHAQGIVHRDIKPSNLMVTGQGALKVLDMGLAQMRGGESNLDLTSDVTQTGRVMGTVDYMAPEQARDAKNVDLRADIYSLGCTLFFLVTGKTPAPGTSAPEKLLWHQTAEAPPLSSVCPQSTPRLDRLLARMLAKRPEDRPATMLEVARELEACRAELPPADLVDLVPGGELLAVHTSATLAGSNYGQPTQVGLDSDTMVNGRKLAPPGGARAAGSGWRLFAYACAGVGAAALVLVLSLPFVARSGGGAKGQAELRVTVDGGPAKVVVNGQVRGQATAGQALPVEVTAGQVTVRVEREGYEPFEQTVTAAPGRTVEVAARLQKAERLPAPLAVSPHADYEPLLVHVFRNKGQVTARTSSGEQLRLAALAELPPQRVEILGIKLDGTGIRDADLDVLTRAPGLRELSLADTLITDEGLARIARLDKLTHLNLSRTGVSSAGLGHLARLSELIELNLERSKVTDAGLTRLLGLSKLQRLLLSDTGVTDVGLEQLQALKSLKLLTLHGTQASQGAYAALKTALPDLDIAWDGADVQRGLALQVLGKGGTLAVIDRAGERHAGIRAASELPPGRISIREIEFSTGSQFADDDLRSVALLPEIEALGLAGVPITAEGLSPLHGLASLKKIDFGHPRVPPTAIEALRKKLPMCQIIVREPMDVQVARQACRLGGKVSVFTSAGQLIADVANENDLPVSGFAVRAIQLDHAASLSDELLASLAELPALEQLFLADTPLEDAAVQKIANCRALRELALSGTRITGNALGNLAKLPKLTRLYLARTGVEGASLASLRELVGLTHLSLEGLKLADDDLAPLKRLPHLEWLDVSMTPLTDEAVVHLAAMKTLREVRVVGTQLSDAAREELAAGLGPRCKLVEDPRDPQRQAARWLVERAATVGLTSGPVTSIKQLPRTACQVVSIDVAELRQLKREELVPQLAACTSLVALNLSNTRLLESDLAFLRSLTNLRELRLANLSISDKVLELLAGHDQLATLDLSGTGVQGTGLRQLGSARQLKHLLLANTRFTETNLPALEAFPELETLDLSATEQLSDAGIEKLAKLAHLRTLGLRRAKITDAAAEKLALLANLEQLDLEQTQLTDAGVARLAGLANLRQLNLAGTQVTGGVASTLGQMKNLRVLNLARTTVPAEAVAQLKTQLPDCAITAPALQPREPAGQGPLGTGGPAGTGENIPPRAGGRFP